MSDPCPTPDDRELMSRYARDGDEDAFAELAARYVDLVHSAVARRLGCDPAGAADVTQSVFVELARNAARLSSHPAMIGWIYTTAHRMASRHLRDGARRKRREEAAAAMLAVDAGPGDAVDWGRVAPELEAAMHEIREPDRVVLLLRFFQGCSFGEIGSRLGTSENAARMRSERALARLRGRLARRGITSTSAALAGALSGSSVVAAPPGLSGVATAAALSHAAAPAGMASLFALMATTKLKLAVAGLVLGGLGSAWIVHQSSEIAALRGRNRSLEERIAAQEAVVSSAPTAAPAEDAGSLELLRLRGEVARLTVDLAQARARPPVTGRTGSRDQDGWKPIDADAAVDTATPESASMGFLRAVQGGDPVRFREFVELAGEFTAEARSGWYDFLYRRMTNNYGGRQFTAMYAAPPDPVESAAGLQKVYLSHHDPGSGKDDDLLVRLRRKDGVWRVLVDDIPGVPSGSPNP